jgi:glycosyltransferase involved in cell wall biosynthesis
MTSLPCRSGAPPARSAPWVLVSAGFHFQGGQSKANAALAAYLLGRGTPVHLVAHDLDDRFTHWPGCTVHQVPRPAGADLLGVYGLRRRGRSVARAVRAVDPGARVLVNGGCCAWGDLNWVHYVHSAWRPARGAGPPWSRVKERIASRLFRRHERQALRMARLVLANSEQTRHALVDRLDLDPARVHTVYLGCDPNWRPPTAAERSAARDRLGQSAERPLAIFVGGLGHDERKGFDTLWAAWESLCREPTWDADLVVAGDGAGAAAWQARVASVGLANRVRLLGFTDRVFDLLAAADLLVSPVRYEPYGLNVQEAICRGVPALVSKRAGVAECFPESLGDMILPDPEDWRDLAARILRWRTDLDGWRAQISPLGDQMRSHTWERMAGQIVALAEGDAA